MPDELTPVEGEELREGSNPVKHPHAARADMRGLRETRRMPAGKFELREIPNGHGGSDLLCSGYASVTCPDTSDLSNAYEMEDWLGGYQEATIRGFAEKTIRDDCDTVFWANHGEGGAIPMARTKVSGTLRLGEDLTGLNYEARLNPSRADVMVLRAAVEDGLMTESSFAFRVIRQEWNEDYTQRFIREVSLDRGDVSPVTFGANPHTGDHPLSMRSAVGALLSARGLSFDAWTSALGELRAGKAISQATMDALAPIHDYLGQGSDHARSLGDLLGLDDEEEEEADEEASDAGDGGEEMLAWTPPVILPDYTHAARAALAAARRR